jgi:hypothetical protein
MVDFKRIVNVARYLKIGNPGMQGAVPFMKKFNH